MSKKKSPIKQKPDPIMPKIKALFEQSGMSLQELGEAMGYDSDFARKSAWQFLRSGDPRISMVRRFVKATGKKWPDFLK